MNVYDFDETVFKGDTEVYFFNYMFRRIGAFPWKLNYRFYEWISNHKMMRKTKAREKCYRILRAVDDIDAVLEDFWDEHEKYLLDWYLKAKRPDDVIASGTPAFLMIPIVKRLGLTELIATDMDKHTGKVNGNYVVLQEKVTEFRKKFPGQTIDNFYSDSWTDHFLAEIAVHAYAMDEKYEPQDWDAYFDAHPEKKKVRYNL